MFEKLFVLIERILKIYIFISLSMGIYNAQSNMSFRRYLPENGLSQSSVFSICQDYMGYIWVGTSDGLNKFDGYTFEIYKNNPFDTLSLSGNVIYSIFEDSRKNLWIGTLGDGLNLFYRKKNIFFRYKNISCDSNSISSNFIRKIFEDKKGRLWIATNNGLNKLNPLSGKFIRYYFSNNHPKKSKFADYLWDIEQTNDTTFWIATYEGLIRFNPETGNFKFIGQGIDDNNKFQHRYIWDIEVISDTVLYIGTLKGLSEFITTSLKVKNYSFDNPDDISVNNVFKIFKDQSALWIGTKGGLIKAELYIKTYNIYTNNINNLYSISNNNVWSIYKDRFGTLWIGTDIGLNSFDPSRNKFFSISALNEFNGERITNNHINCIIKDKFDNLYIGTSNGLNILNNNLILKTIRLENLADALPSNYVSHLLEDSFGRIWIGTSEGLSVYYPEKNKFETKNFFKEGKLNLTNNRITCILESEPGVFWIGTFDGLFKYDENSNKLIKIETPSEIIQPYISYIIKLYDIIFVGYYNGFLSQVQINDNKQYIVSRLKNNPYSREIYAMYVDQDNFLLIGGIKGLIKYNPLTQQTNVLIPNENIHGILMDNKNRYWLSTNKGIILYSEDKGIIKRFDLKDGLLSLQFISKSFYKDKNGNFYFGGINGLNYFHPEKIVENVIPPQIALKNIFINNQPLSSTSEITKKTSIESLKELNLKYDQNFIIIEFSALHFASPENNLYSFKLEGYDKDWIESKDKRYAIYSNIPPGKYKFYLKVANFEGFWTTEPLILNIAISPPLWKTTFAYVFYFIASIFILVYTFYSYDKRRKREIEILKKADKLKDDFLAQISDEIRTPVHNILSFTNLIKDELGENISEDLKFIFSSINSAGKRITRTIDLILNMSELKNGSYKPIFEKHDIVKLLYKISAEYQQSAKNKNLYIDLIISSSNNLCLIDEYSVSQIFANLLNNAIKYTHKGGIKIKVFNNDNSSVTVVFEDTGIGISKEFLPKLFGTFEQEETGYTRKYEGNGLGLALVKKYCEINNAYIWVESEKGKGSKFYVRFSLFNEEKFNEIIKTDKLKTQIKNI